VTDGWHATPLYVRLRGKIYRSNNSNFSTHLLCSLIEDKHFWIHITEILNLNRSFPENPKKIMWDNSITDKDVFVVLDGENVVHTFIIYGDDVEEGGTSCVCLGTTKVKKSFLKWVIFFQVWKICRFLWASIQFFSLEVNFHYKHKVENLWKLCCQHMKFHRIFIKYEN